MTLAAGSKLRASELIAAIPQRIATTTRTTSTSTFTAETVTDSVTAALVSGKTYKVVCNQGCSSSVAADSETLRIREDSISGTQIQAVRVPLTVASVAVPGRLEVDYVAVATGNKTFVVTGLRASGTGNLSHIASTGQPNNIYVELVVSGL